MLAAVGKAASHAGRTTLYLTLLHGKAHILKPLIANIRAALAHVRATAEQFKRRTRGRRCCATSASALRLPSAPSDPRTGS